MANYDEPIRRKKPRKSDWGDYDGREKHHKEQRRKQRRKKEQSREEPSDS